jgi:hypothetical protein
MVQIGKKAAVGPKKGKKALTFTIDCAKPVEDKVRAGAGSEDAQQGCGGSGGRQQQRGARETAATPPRRAGGRRRHMRRRAVATGG